MFQRQIMPSEIELKLSIKPADIPRLRRHPVLKEHLADKPVTRHLVSTYFDTPDLQLLAHDISLRVRRMSGGWFQAVKAAGHSLAGLHQRMEWEDIINGPRPDFSKLSKVTEPALASIFASQALRDALKPLFVTDVQRTEWQLRFEDGSAVEAALDLGTLKAHGKTEPLSEIELELKHGSAHHLFELALALQADIALHIENISKAQRGYAHYRAATLAIAKAENIVLGPKASVHEAFGHIVGECLRQLQSNQDMVLHGDDPEGVHQMRVAVRRLDAATRLFRHKPPAAELGWIGNVLGTARNWDVMLTETLPAAREQLQGNGFDALQQQSAAAQKRAYARLRTALNSQRYQRLQLSLGAWLQAGPPHGADKFGKVAGRAMHRQLEKIKSCGQNLHDLSPPLQHKVRIKAKRLRYAVEFFAGSFSAGKQAAAMQAFSGRLAALQKSLGRLNDIAVTAALLRRLSRRLADDGLTARIVGWNAQRIPALLKKADKSWRALHRARPCWD